MKQFDQDQIVVGRSADVGLDLDSDEVSAIHCLIELRDGGYYICDLGSTSGTFKNGEVVLDAPLVTGDEIGVGPFKISFFVGVPKPKSMPAPAAVAPAAVAPAVAAAAAVPAAQPTPVAAPPAAAPAETPVVTPAAPVAPVSIPAEVPAAVAAPSIPVAVPVEFKPEVREEPKVVENKPRITATPVVAAAPKIENRALPQKPQSTRRKDKNKKTFAPSSEIKDLRDYIRPGKGNVVEVLVAWKERVLTTYHYRTPGIVRLGPGEKYDINMPDGVCPTGWPLVEVGPETRLAVTNEMGVEVITAQGRKSVDELLRTGKAQRSGNSMTIKLDQQEVYFITLPFSELQLVVRFVPQPPIVPVPPWLLSSTEMTGLAMSFILVFLLALYISAVTPKMQEEEKQPEIVAQVVFNKPKPTPEVVKIAEQKPDEVKPPPPPKPTPTPPPKKVVVADKQKEAVSKGKNPDAAQAAKNSKAGQAAEVAPKPNSENKPKKFTSTKQGGAIKQGDTAGANAQSANKDMSKVGLFAAFGGGGMRKNLDKAYSGSGDVLGMADKATGAAGFNENRNGDDIGSKFKDTGAGGKGTATQGIAGVGTKGRGSGMGTYGSGDGLGDKNSVAIEPGGVEEDFVGTIDREAVRRVIKAGIREIRGCYERELSKINKNQRLEGKVTITWKIVEHGRAVAARVANSTLGNRAVENCVRDRLSTWKFPDPPAGTEAEVSYPFAFRAEN